MHFIPYLFGRHPAGPATSASQSGLGFRLAFFLLIAFLIGMSSRASAQSYQGYPAFEYAYQAYDSCLSNMQEENQFYKPSDYVIYAPCVPGQYQGYSGYLFSHMITNPIYTAYGELIDNWSTYGQNASNYLPPKNLGCSCGPAGNSPIIGNPINAATGNKYEEEADFSQGDLSFIRYYNSDPNAVSSTMGFSWISSYDRSISFAPQYSSNNEVVAPTLVRVLRSNGQMLAFNKTNGVWVSGSGSDVDDQLTEIDNADGTVASWSLFVADMRQYEAYTALGELQSISDQSRVLVSLTYTPGTQQSSISTALSPGLLSTVTDAHGLSLTFHYDSSARIASVTLPDGGTLQYAYSNNLLSGVTYPDGKTRQYLYDESAYSAVGSGVGKLTGIIDESGARFATYGYESDGRAISTQHGGGADLYTASYSSDGGGTYAAITYPLGQQSTATFMAPQGTAIVKSMSARCGTACNQQYQSQTFDSNGYPASYTDFNNNLTTTQYDANGLLHQQVDASGSAAQRTTTTTWNTTLRVPLTRTVLNAATTTVASTAWVYNAVGQTLARCDIDPTNSAATGYACAATGTVPAGVRRSTYTYCTAVDTVQCPIIGLVLTATGPRTDLTQTTTYTYYTSSSATNCGTPGAACYQAGDLYQITDALGHVTTIASYDGAGRVTRMTDSNGVNTDTTYTPRGTPRGAGWPRAAWAAR